MKRNILLPILSLLLLSGCISNPDQGVYYVGGSSTPTTVPTRTAVSHTDEAEFEGERHCLEYIRGYVGDDRLRGICIVRKISSPNIIRIVDRPNMPDYTHVCVVTGLQFNPENVPRNEADYVIDIDEMVCGRADEDFVMRYSDYNVVTIVNDHFALEDYIYGYSDEYPSIAEGQIERDANYNNY